ncbi:MAG: CBS domain-containing protein, partial [Nitrososphaerales archaeon]|nr:CBS domain-containing protein [Nitrososphaerales archaeon]
PIDIFRLASVEAPMAEEEPTVAELMERKVISVEMNSNVRDCAKAMSKRMVSCAVVVRGGGAVGIVTERDLVTKVIADALDPAKVLVRDIMSTPLITISPEATMSDAAELMSQYMIRRLIVIGPDGNLVGIITSGDLAKALAKKHDYKEVALNALARVRGEPTGGPYQ